jgi:membrane protease YdiL (CAAX protease family)
LKIGGSIPPNTVSWSKGKCVGVVSEGFIIVITAQVLSPFFVDPLLIRIIPELPQVTLTLMASPTGSVLGIVYLAIRTRIVPRLSLNKEMYVYFFLGIAMAWITTLLYTLVAGKDAGLVKASLDTSRPFRYLNACLLTIWGPVAEETLFRGFFFHILRSRWSIAMAGLFSSLLFVLLHTFSGIDTGLLFIFLYSVVFTITYIRGGLIASILVHGFVNAYWLYLI